MLAINAAALRSFDVAVIDDRSWAGLGGERAEVMAAVRGGMGLVLRSGGPGDGAAGQWRSLGFSVSGGEALTPIALPEAIDADVERTRRGVPSPDAMADLDVDEAVKFYERGMEISKELEAYLKDAENKVTKIKADWEAGGR